MFKLDIASISNFSEAAKIWCIEIINIMNSDDIRYEISLTDDNGVMLEFFNGEREVTFVIPNDAEVTYFVARDTIDFITSGVITDNIAIINLSKWLTGYYFSELGLIIG